MSKFLILLGGDLTVTPRLLKQIAGARILAADSGMRHAAALGVTPELWLGDFDSTDAALADSYQAIDRQVFPAAKAMTDGELALHEAYERGATEVILAGAFGGERTDHTFLHLSMAAAQAATGKHIFLTSGFEEATPLAHGMMEFDLPNDTLFSILGFDTLTRLTISGAEWPLDEVSVPFGSSLTLSNRVKDKLTVALGAGHAVLLASPLGEMN
ncbi:thiamine diphosphokinase [Pseudochrobactrum sp. MP213Fo]|uniref:thiamine diphosphokinase n=1 Tax=Pseudochrobactrum sp. MP213Fo TaxID=3022250 RepID=UPI003BA36A96